MQKILHFDSLDQNLLHSSIKYFVFHLSRCKISWFPATVGLVHARPLTWFAASAAIVAEIAATIVWGMTRTAI
jgi:hypothetical protein